MEGPMEKTLARLVVLIDMLVISPMQFINKVLVKFMRILLTIPCQRLDDIW